MADIFMERTIELRTVARIWKDRIRQLYDVGEWPILFCGNAILELTVAHEMSDEKIAQEMSDYGQTITARQVRKIRAEALRVLFDLFREVLLERAQYHQDYEVLAPMIKSVEAKLRLIEAYLASKGKNRELEAELHQYTMGGNIGRVVGHYLDVCSEIYAERSQEFKSIADLATSTGYSGRQISSLISSGIVAGVRIGKTWYGRESDIVQYQQQQTSIGSPRGPR